jgi:hypothetical protein
LEGEHSYIVVAVVDDQIPPPLTGEATSSDSVEVSSSVVPESPGPSDTAGLIFSIILLLVGLTGVVFSFIPRRD